MAQGKRRSREMARSWTYPEVLHNLEIALNSGINPPAAMTFIIDTLFSLGDCIVALIAGVTLNLPFRGIALVVGVLPACLVWFWW